MDVGGLLYRFATEGWPAKMAGGIVDAVKLPGQVAGGLLETKPAKPGVWSDEDEARSQLTQQGIYDRATDMAGLVMGGGYGAAPAGSLGMAGAKPRSFWRGENPGDTRRIATGNETWDGHLFMADNPKSAQMYGSHLTQYEAAPDAKILYEGTKDFIGVAGKWRKGESLLDYSNRAAEAARAAGYDAVHFKRQSDVGTAVFNRDKFIKK